MVSSMGPVAVIGGGWAGLAAAVQLVKQGRAVTLYEMAGQLGGRARRASASADGHALDNGQHILIGAYTAALALMRDIGVDPALALRRSPMSLRTPDGAGLTLPAGNAVLAFLRATLAQGRWPWRDRLGLLRAAIGWRAAGFRCAPTATVAELTHRLSRAIQQDLIEPLCVAALNTPSRDASGQVFLTVLRDALFAGPGAADLLLPRQPLSALLPEPAQRWLRDQGATVHLGHRTQQLARGPGTSWQVDGVPFAAVVLSATAVEAARLAAPHAPGWSAVAGALHSEPITSVTVSSPGTRLDQPMTALVSDEHTRPAQFVFDQSQLNGVDGQLTLVISGAAPWVDRGREAIAEACLKQLRDQLGARLVGTPSVVAVLTDKRATFRCTPGLVRPAPRIAPGLWAAGDYIDGPYPATLEGAVRSGLAAARGVIDGV